MSSSLGQTKEALNDLERSLEKASIVENGFAKWFVSFGLFLSLFTSGFASGEWSGSQHAILHGKIVKKYFKAPRVMKDPPFGWFVELEAVSQKKTIDLFQNLSEKEKAVFGDADLKYVRLIADKFAVREWAHNHHETQVTLEGELSEPDLFGEFRAFNFTPENVTPSITEKEKALACLALDKKWCNKTSIAPPESNCKKYLENERAKTVFFPAS